MQTKRDKFFEKHDTQVRLNTFSAVIGGYSCDEIMLVRRSHPGSS